MIILRRGIVWDKKKNNLLVRERGLSLETFALMIAKRKHIAVIDNPARDGQFICICRHDDYIHAVPFVLDRKGDIVLKTVFPSRKYQKVYGGESNEGD